MRSWHRREIPDVSFGDMCHWFPRQDEAESAANAHQFTLYGGSRGPGKSYWLRWYLLRRLLRFSRDGHRGVTVGLFCENYPTLKDRQVGKIANEFPTWMGRVKDTQDRGLGFHVLPRYGGGALLLRNLDEAGKYKSAEFAAIGVDQLEQNPVEAFNLLRGSLRWPGVARPPFLATANPGGIGHLWIKQYWRDREFPPELRPLADEFAFVEARPDDNPHLDASYWQMLETLPPALAQAWRFGNWDIFEGQVFDEWRRDVHVVEPFAIPADWPRFRALDYGYSAPSCVGWFAVDRADWRSLYLYRELYETGLAPADLAQRIVAMTPVEERIQYTAADPSIFAVNAQTGASNADVMAANGVPCTRGHNDRISGWRMLHQYLKVIEAPVGGQMMPTARLKVVGRLCPNTVRTLPAQVYDRHQTEDLDSAGEDHAADMVRYAIMSRPPLDLGWTPRHTDEILDTAGRTLAAIRRHATRWG